MFRFGIPQSGVLDAYRTAGDHQLTLRVRNLRMNRDGYARGLVGMIVGTAPIHSTIVEVDDAEDRHKFALALYGTLTRNGTGRKPLFGPDIVQSFPLADFEQEFMVWSRAVWGAYIGASSGNDIEGDLEPSAPPWVIPGLVMKGSTGIWAGNGGAGKSTLARMACQAIRHGIDDVVPIKDQEFPIWVNAEEAPEEHTRQLGNVNQALGLKRNAAMYTIHARGMRIDDLASRLEKAVRERNAKHVFIDSLSRLAQGMSLNDNNTATLLVDTIAGAAPGCSVTWLGHTGWENQFRLAGSRHFENAARVMVLVQSRMSQRSVSADLFRGVRTRVTKANGAIETSPMHWSLAYHRQNGLMSAELSCPEDWPMLYCDFLVGEAGKSRVCGRATWDGVLLSGDVRCTRHRDEEGEA